jgi:hypothetical protein
MRSIQDGKDKKKDLETLPYILMYGKLLKGFRAVSWLTKVHEKSIVEYRALVVQAREYRIRKVSYAESQQLLEQERLGTTISQKTFYNLLRRQPGDSSNSSTINRPPGKLTPTRAPPAMQSTPEPSQQALPPLSTAPAILYKGKGGKERKRTNKAAESKAAGWLTESQPRE